MLTQVRKSCDYFFHYCWIWIKFGNGKPNSKESRVSLEFWISWSSRVARGSASLKSEILNSVATLMAWLARNLLEKKIILRHNGEKINEYFYVWWPMKTRYEKVENTLFQMIRSCILKSNYKFQILRIFLLSSRDWHIFWSNIFFKLRIVGTYSELSKSVDVNSVLQSKRKHFKIFIKI